MTGYGRGTCEVAGRRLVVELRIVNHRFLELKLRLPWADAALEAHVTAALRARLARGVVTVERARRGRRRRRKRCTPTSGWRGSITTRSTSCARRSALDEPVSLALVAAQPGVITVGESVRDPEALWRAHRARPRGGARGAGRGARARGRGAARRSRRAARRRSRQCARDLGDADRARRPTSIASSCASGSSARSSRARSTPQRLAQEVAILADKADVTEELTRLAAHLDRVRRRLADEEGANGRRLDFLTQELNREVNTIGSKSQSAHGRGARRRRQGRSRAAARADPECRVSMARSQRALLARGVVAVGGRQDDAVSPPDGGVPRDRVLGLVHDAADPPRRGGGRRLPLRRRRRRFDDDGRARASSPSGPRCTATRTAPPSRRCARRSRAGATCSFDIDYQGGRQLKAQVRDARRCWCSCCRRRSRSSRSGCASARPTLPR